MKKLIGLLASGTLCMFAACSSGDDDNSITPVASNNNGGNNSSVPTKESCEAMGMTLNFDQASGQLYCAPATQSSPDMQTGLSSSSFDPYGTSQTPTTQPGITPVAQSSSSGLNIVPATNVSSSSVAPTTTPTTPSSPSTTTPTTPTTTPTTPAVDADDGLFKIGLWDGSTGSNQVPTGNSNGGYWYSYTDSGNSGASTLEWDATAQPGSTYSDDDLTPIITECGGLCGSFNLVAGDNTDCAPYVAVAFNYAKTDKTAADATSSKGLCVTYKSTMAIEVDLGLGSKDGTYGYNLPAIVLPKSTTLNTVNAKWAEFKQQWEGAKDLTGPEAAAMLAAVKFQIKGSEVGVDEGTGTFLITKVGGWGLCE